MFRLFRLLSAALIFMVYQKAFSKSWSMEMKKILTHNSCLTVYRVISLTSLTNNSCRATYPGRDSRFLFRLSQQKIRYFDRLDQISVCFDFFDQVSVRIDVRDQTSVYFDFLDKTLIFFDFLDYLDRHFKKC